MLERALRKRSSSGPALSSSIEVARLSAEGEVLRRSLAAREAEVASLGAALRASQSAAGGGDLRAARGGGFIYDEGGDEGELPSVAAASSSSAEASLGRGGVTSGAGGSSDLVRRLEAEKAALLDYIADSQAREAALQAQVRKQTWIFLCGCPRR